MLGSTKNLADAFLKFVEHLLIELENKAGQAHRAAERIGNFARHIELNG